MKHFPIFINMCEKLVVVSGAGETAVAKLRLLLKTPANIKVFGTEPNPDVEAWASAGKLELVGRSVATGDLKGAQLVYAANDDPVEDRRVADISKQRNVLCNVVDNIKDSVFITPAIVDRSPVVVAIGTEGSAPILARKIKASVERLLPMSTGSLASIARSFRGAVSEIACARSRRAFWFEFFDKIGPTAFSNGGANTVKKAIKEMLEEARSSGGSSRKSTGTVWLVGAGPGDPELLTQKAVRLLDKADVVVADRLVSSEVLELSRREAKLVKVGKMPGGPSWAQEDINKLMIVHANSGEMVVRLKSGDPSIYGRLDEEMEALDTAGVPYQIVPGITSALAASAQNKVSLTRRERNSDCRFLTGHDIDGFAEHDWQALAKSNVVASIYMGVRSARFLQGRLLMHGADPMTPLIITENISRVNEKVIATTLGDLAEEITSNKITGPSIITIGVTPRSYEPYAFQDKKIPSGATQLSIRVGA